MSEFSNASIFDIAGRTWDALVIGAGPAGAVTARQMAQHGIQTLLVDAKPFPRTKVCGGSLNTRALSVLKQCGLEHVLRESRGSHVNEFYLVVGGRSELFRLPTGLAVSRATFDYLLARAAVQAGVTFVDQVQAFINPHVSNGWREVSLHSHGEQASLRARVVVCADGLARSSLRRLAKFRTETAPGSRVGVGMVAQDDGTACPAGRIAMVVTNVGYVGLTRISADKISIAAALDPVLLRESRSGDVLIAILAEAGVIVPPGTRPGVWQGTPPLTSRPNRVAAERLFVVGDASGYVEPFTGEGIAAALEGAVALAALAVESCLNWNPALAAHWEAIHRQVVYDRQATCRRLAWVLRHPVATSTMLTLCQWFPHAARHVMHRVNQPSLCRQPTGMPHP